MLKENSQVESENNEKEELEKDEMLAEVKAEKKPVRKRRKNIERTKKEEEEIKDLKTKILENYDEKENEDVVQENSVDLETNNNKPKDEKKGFKGLIGKFARSFVLATSLITGSLATAEQASAQDKTAVKNVEKKENLQEKQKAIELLKKLYDLDPKGESKAQDRLKKYRVAQSMINVFALEQKLGFPDRKKQEKISGHVSPDDMKKALKALDANLNNFIEKEFEEKDKKLTKEEKNKKLEEVIKSNLGISYLKEKLSEGIEK